MQTLFSILVLSRGPSYEQGDPRRRKPFNNGCISRFFLAPGATFSLFTTLRGPTSFLAVGKGGHLHGANECSRSAMLLSRSFLAPFVFSRGLLSPLHVIMPLLQEAKEGGSSAMCCFSAHTVASSCYSLLPPLPLLSLVPARDFLPCWNNDFR